MSRMTKIPFKTILAGLEVETLARAIISEVGARQCEPGDIRGSRGYLISRCVLNIAEREQRDTFAVAVASTPEWGDIVGESGILTGRPFSTRFEATYFARAQAALAVSDHLDGVPDPTQGATHWFDPADEDALKGRVPGYTRSAADIRAAWTKDGLSCLSAVAGLEFWGTHAAA